MEHFCNLVLLVDQGRGVLWFQKEQNRIWEAGGGDKRSRVWIRALILVVIIPEIATILAAVPCIGHSEKR